MSEKNETIAEIVRDKRELAARIKSSLSSVPARRDDELAEARAHERDADRIEAAAKREKELRDVKRQPVGDVAAMREALEMMSTLFERGVICTSYANSAEEMEQIEELYRKAKAALSEPPRNCDVGTADEQAQRYGKFCEEHDCYARNPLHACPLHEDGFDCRLRWAQMPYEEGGAE